MKHLGDITKLRGCDVPIVDCVIGGSPCQGLSNAGKRLGLDDERSGLYMEQIRITKEMRAYDRIRRGADESISPRYMVWENVPGAFSTGDPKGADFQAVLEEAIRIADPEAPSIPIPPKGWNTSGCIVDGLGRWSLAWRVTDAQYWGVPQRRRRICMVVDFNGVTAPQIVFGDAELQRSTASAGGNKAVGHLGAECGREVSSVEDGLRGHLAESEPQREEAAGDAGGGIEVAGARGYDIGEARLRTPSEYIEKSPTITARCGTGGNNVPAVVFGISPYHSNAMMSSNPHGGIVGADLYNYALTGDTAVTLTASSCVAGARSGPSVLATKFISGVDLYNQSLTRDVAKPLTNAATDADHIPVVIARVGTFQETGIGWWNESEIGATLRAQSGGDALKANLCAFAEAETGTHQRYIVRRLTPLECERLQGYPDNWTLIGEPVEKVVEEFDEDTGEKTGEHIEQEFYYINSRGKRVKASDSARYKALGNSISIPNWKYIIKRLCAHYERDATMASLFDGIGGFPYIWEQLNGKGSCLWASEIEEFPMAVTKLRFGGAE